MEMGEMYMKHTNYNETGILPPIADMENSFQPSGKEYGSHRQADSQPEAG